jgi:hypothetical protein
MVSLAVVTRCPGEGKLELQCSRCKLDLRNRKGAKKSHLVSTGLTLINSQQPSFLGNLKHSICPLLSKHTNPGGSENVKDMRDTV